MQQPGVSEYEAATFKGKTDDALKRATLVRKALARGVIDRD
jgi:hypothetical protein